MISQMNKHVNKLGVQKQLPNQRTIPNLQTWWLSHQNSLIAMHLYVFIKSMCIHHQGTIPLTSCESPHLHQKNKVGVLVPIFFWVLGGQSCKEPKHFYQQNLHDVSYQNKTLLNGLAATMCTFVHLRMLMCVGVIMMCNISICMMMICMNMWSLFL